MWSALQSLISSSLISLFSLWLSLVISSKKRKMLWRLAFRRKNGNEGSFYQNICLSLPKRTYFLKDWLFKVFLFLYIYTHSMEVEWRRKRKWRWGRGEKGRREGGGGRQRGGSFHKISPCLQSSGRLQNHRKHNYL